MTKIIPLLLLAVLFGAYETIPRARAEAVQWVPVDGSCRQTEARNKEVVLNFLNEFFVDKNIGAADKYISAEKYIQHNPLVADGVTALKTKAQKEWFKGPEKGVIQIGRTSAEGDLVWVHYKTLFLGQWDAIVDIFRLENFKIVEHWDVIQPIPDKTVSGRPMV